MWLPLWVRLSWPTWNGQKLRSPSTRQMSPTIFLILGGSLSSLTQSSSSHAYLVCSWMEGVASISSTLRQTMPCACHEWQYGHPMPCSMGSYLGSSLFPSSRSTYPWLLEVSRKLLHGDAHLWNSRFPRHLPHHLGSVMLYQVYGHPQLHLTQAQDTRPPRDHHCGWWPLSVASVRMVKFQHCDAACQIPEHLKTHGEHQSRRCRPSRLWLLYTVDKHADALPNDETHDDLARVRATQLTSS